MTTQQSIDGLLHAYVLQPDGRGRQISAAEIAGWSAADGVLWLHFDFNHDGTYAWLSQHSGLSDVAIDVLTVDQTRPRTLSLHNGVLVALRGVNTNPGDDPEDMVSIRVWVEKDRVISARRRALLAIHDICHALDEGEGPASSDGFLADLANRLADRIGDFIDDIEDRLLNYEEHVSAEAPESKRRELSVARRQIANVRRFIAPQRDALDRLYRNPGEWFSDTDTQNLREEADRITRYVEDLDLARERAVLLQEEFLSVIAQQQNSRMYVLSIVAAIFLPLMFVTGLLGMNVGGLPGVNSDYGFLASVVIMLVCGVAAALILRWKRWV
ncbi:MAG TPA: zinc transporter ZntB [Woeseiaceae bacterium]|nr:zinc transporter ZntB [Woeseiaceae bacterium]